MTAWFSRVGVAAALVVGAVWLGTLFATTSCGTQCERNPNEAVVSYAAGTASGAGTLAGSYQSAPWHGPYIDFPPGRTYRFEHRLGGCPKSIQVWGSFNPAPVASSNAADAAPPMGGSAVLVGNQATVERVTATTLDVRNDTCSDVLIRVEASAPDFSAQCPSTAHAPKGDASTTRVTTDGGNP